ncbi:hypothetical protein [Aerosakkonema funiforme]|uniref:hypothetical protein n=1 Tax=Aerosakkonema funiforme TaxID=1246630 RepID=UPI0035B95A0A
MQATNNSAFLDNYNFPPETTSQTIALARVVVQLGSSYTATIGGIKQQSLELGDKLLQLETALGETELKELLKHCFPKEIVRYFRNVLAQAKLLEKCPQLYDKILNMPICHAAALLAGTETQIKEILKEDVKWTISLIKQRVKAENSCPITIPEIAIGNPVKILASDSEHSGNIALVQHIQTEQDIISVQLLSGEKKEFYLNEVKAIDPDAYLELNIILSTSLNLHSQFKTAAARGDEQLTKEIESKITKLDKCRRQLSARLGLSDKAVNNLANLLANNPTAYTETIASSTECDRAIRVWKIAPEQQEPIIAKAQLLGKLRTFQVDAQPTTGELAIAIASHLYKSSTKRNGGGIQITAREYSELTELIQQQSITIQQLKAELDLLREQQPSTGSTTATAKADSNTSEELSRLRQEIQALRQTYESLQQMYNAGNAQLAEYKQLVQEKTVLLSQQETASNTNSPAAPPKEKNNIGCDMRVIVVNHDTWGGYPGTVVQKWSRDPDSWWVVLDYIAAKGQTQKILLKTSSLIPELPEYEPLQKQLSKFEEKIIEQRLELQEYRQIIAEKEQQKEKEIETIASEFGLVAELLGWSGWTTRGGYRSTDGQRYSGLEAFKAFINDMRDANASNPVEDDIEF